MTTRDGRLRLTLLGLGSKPIQDVVDIWIEHEKLSDRTGVRLIFRTLQITAGAALSGSRWAVICNILNFAHQSPIP